MLQRCVATRCNTAQHTARCNAARRTATRRSWMRRSTTEHCPPLRRAAGIRGRARRYRACEQHSRGRGDHAGATRMVCARATCEAPPELTATYAQQHARTHVYARTRTHPCSPRAADPPAFIARLGAARLHTVRGPACVVIGRLQHIETWRAALQRAGCSVLHYVLRCNVVLGHALRRRRFVGESPAHESDQPLHLRGRRCCAPHDAWKPKRACTAQPANMQLGNACSAKNCRAKQGPQLPVPMQP
jgi:hypothetical protein